MPLNMRSIKQLFPAKQKMDYISKDSGHTYTSG